MQEPLYGKEAPVEWWQQLQPVVRIRAKVS